MVVTTAKTKKAKQSAPKTPTTRTAGNVTIKYKCKRNVLGQKKCNAEKKFAHLGKKGSTIDLVTIGTAVQIHFLDGSPFGGGDISIPADSTQTETVAVSSGLFRYEITCGACRPKGPKGAGPPQMIVP